MASTTTPLPLMNVTITTTPVLNVTAHVNASGYVTDDDPEEVGLTELQTIGIACIATLIPLTVSFVAFYGCRVLWKEWRRNGEERSIRRADSSDPNKSSDLLLPDEIKTSESQFSVIPAEELEEVLTSYNSAPSDNSNNHNHTRKSTANGSIITMTMKNNHLIVETEERIPGVSELPCTPNLLEDLPPEEDSMAQVHQSQEEVKEGSNTGLSQSDLSLSPSGSANPAYSYGNQLEYEGDEREVPQVRTVAAVRAKIIPFTVQPSQDIEDDEGYLEQQHQLGKGVDDLQAVPEVFSQHCTPYENPAFVPTPEQPQVNPIS